ncbi:hypothetical protein CY34DRAFT_769608 [Suillus luteus UH-Slu-Lm8-n1]|uniref:Uncharacterized protein n=1 Tax=Suillus luteus UH-Slu-Lm8-n1 TaxID=930992 RepID=A0A0D0B682_9AGAM|nr:hypothetical protein CY34DRAFT_769608 [Suillus luteus UH-Slu-Lm8-n1]
MLRLLCIALSLFLSLQLAVADPASTVDRISRHSKSSSQVLTKSVISALLVRRGKFGARAGDSGGCPSGYQQCANYPDACAPFGSYCCNDLYNCPNDTTVRCSRCCPNTAQTCGGNSCCDSGSSCCNDSSCCEPGLFCCNDSTGGCCPTGTTCIAETYQCYTGGSGGGSGSGTGSGGEGGGTSVTTAAAPSKSTVLPGTTSTNVITSTPTKTGSSSSHSVTSSTVSSSGSTSSGITNIGAAPRGIALAPGKQLAALAAVLCLPILHNVAQAL